MRNWARQLWMDLRGQDLIEYALLLSFCAVSVGATVPGVADGIGTTLSKVGSVLDVAAGNAGLATQPAPTPPAPTPPQQRDNNGRD